MARNLAFIPWIGLIVYQWWGSACGFQVEVMQPLSLGLALGLMPIIWYRRLVRLASDLEPAIPAYLILVWLGFWLLPGPLGQALAATAPYGVFFLAAAVPPLWGQEPFTCHFARRHVPPAVWKTALFREINQHLTIFWAGLFALSFLLSLAGELCKVIASSRLQFVFAFLLPLALLAGLGLSVTRWYPAYHRRRLGLLPADCQPGLRQL